MALWREALLAQKVLAGATRGYQRHPQLHRFLDHPEPHAAIATYLRAVWDEAERRGYHFDRSKIAALDEVVPMELTTGQLQFEWDHLLAKLRTRAPSAAATHQAVGVPIPHPLFRVVPGPIADWERGPA